MNGKCPKAWLKFFKAACDEQRQGILDVIHTQGSIKVNDIVAQMNISQPTVSHHLKIMIEAGMVSAEKKGKEVYYTIEEDAIRACCEGFQKKFCPCKKP